MPKTLEAVSSGPLKKITTVPQPGEARKAADIETPVRDLLNNDAFLEALLSAATELIKTHGHDLATDTKAGFMSPGDRQNISGFMAKLDSHGHVIVTTSAPGFMSAADKVKLNGIEVAAQKITRAKVEEALGIKRGSITIPATTIGGGQSEIFYINMDGVKFADSVAASEYSANGGNIVISYHCAEDRVEVRARNLSGSSQSFAASVNVTVLPA